MLQIISGRVFAGNDVEERESDAILYSNLSWIAPISTDVMELRPADGFLSASVSSYVVRYVNRMERGGALVLADANEAVDQFRWLASFWFRAYFHPDQRQVEHLCRQAPRTVADRTLPHRFVPRFFEPTLRATASEAVGFREFVRKAISMPRLRYRQIMVCLGTFFDSLEVIGANFDLAYSMMVYVLEALSKATEVTYAPDWADYDDAAKKRLAPVFRRLPPEDRSEIQRALMSEKEFKLKQRFVNFIVSHTTNSFFTDEDERIPHALPRSKLEASLKTLYDTRSGFVHELTKVREQLHHPELQAVTSDYMEWEQKPYLTFSGLVRLTHHIIGVFINRQESSQHEDYSGWRNELPGIIRVNFAPQYWIWKAEDLRPEFCSRYFSGLLQHLASQFPTQEWTCPDMTGVLSKIETLLPDCKDKYRTRLKRLFCLCCWGHPELDDRWRSFLARYEMDRLPCDIEGLAVSVLYPDEPLTWDAQSCEAAFEGYLCDRHRHGRTNLPLVFELAVLARIANLHLANGRREEYAAWLERAVLDAAGQPAVQQYLNERSRSLKSASLRVILGMEGPGDSSG